MASTPLTREQAEALARRVLALSSADEARVNIGQAWSGNTRFAANEITTAGGITDIAVTILSAFGRRSASATTNLLDDASLRRAVETSERIARLSPENPEHLPQLGQQQYAEVRAFSERTADLSPEQRALAASTVLGLPAIREHSLEVSGYIEANASMSAVATSRGLFAYHTSTDANMSTTVRTPDGTGSGYAARGVRDWGDVDAREIGARATDKALRSRNPQAIEPGQYTVVLEPQAVADVLPLLAGSFGARQADEGRSPFARQGGGSKIGEKVADERVTIYSDPADAELLSQPFDAEGLPIRRTVWIENGVLKNLAYSRFWAQKQGREPSGGGGFKMLGGTKSVEQLVAETDRGILVTRFWYIRFLDQRTVMLTGLTRDGTFLIERGKATKSLRNFRWNDSPLFMLNRIDELGRAERTDAGQVVPSLRVRGFNFTSLSEAV